MLNEEKINVIYDKVIEENLGNINREKKQAKIENVIRYIMVVISIIAVYKIVQMPIVYEKYNDILNSITSNLGIFGVTTAILFSYPVFAISCIVIIPLCIYDLMNNRFYNYIHNFNSGMIKEIIKTYNHKLEYLPKKGFDEKEYTNETKFEKFDKYKSSDLTKYILSNNCKLEISQIIGRYVVPNVGPFIGSGSGLLGYELWRQKKYIKL